MDYISKRVLAAHDLSGFGHTSLLAAIAILYRMGIRVAALPTAMLSANTDHEGFSFRSFDDGMKDFIAHWQELGLRFDAAYTGFLGSPDQVDSIIEAIKTLVDPKGFVLVDPVLGDQGKLYSCFDLSMVKAMKKLIKHADLITPNATEAAILLNEDLLEDPDVEWDAIACRLSRLGPSKVVITSIPTRLPDIRLCGVYDKSGDRWDEVIFPVNKGTHPGIGDCFASFLLAGMLGKHSLKQSVRGAAGLINFALQIEEPKGYSWREGLQLEKLLALDYDLDSFYRSSRRKK